MNRSRVIPVKMGAVDAKDILTSIEEFPRSNDLIFPVPANFILPFSMCVFSVHHSFAFVYKIPQNLY